MWVTLNRPTCSIRQVAPRWTLTERQRDALISLRNGGVNCLHYADVAEAHFPRTGEGLAGSDRSSELVVQDGELKRIGDFGRGSIRQDDLLGRWFGENTLPE